MGEAEFGVVGYYTRSVFFNTKELGVRYIVSEKIILIIFYINARCIVHVIVVSFTIGSNSYNMLNLNNLLGG